MFFLSSTAPKLSIVIPVYNAEAYLSQCLDSILTQEFSDIEVLLINDGSVDSSGSICNQYALRDTRVKVFHEKNSGVGGARNIGLNNANGEWVTFVDADDWLPQGALNIFYEKTEAPIIIAPYYEFYQGEMNFPFDFIQSNKELIKKKDLLTQYLSTSLLKTVCGKFYRREIIRNNKFDNHIKLGEDTLFFLRIVLQVDKVFLLSKPLYVYRMFPKTSKYSQNVEDAIYALKTVMSAYDDLNVKVPEFEVCIFCDYKYTCQDIINKNPSLWYDDVYVSFIYQRIKKFLTLEYRLRYSFLRIPILSDIFKVLRKILS